MVVHVLVRSIRALPKVIAVCLLQLGGKWATRALMQQTRGLQGIQAGAWHHCRAAFSAMRWI